MKPKELLVVFLQALFMRLLLFFVSQGRHLTPDSLGYIELARKLALNGSFSELGRTPGYPMFLLLFKSVPIAIMVQAVAGSITCVATSLSAWLLWRRTQWAVLAGLLMAFDPASILHCNMLITETLYTCVFTLGVSMLISALHFDGRELFNFIQSSYMFGMASFIRPIGVLYPPALAAAIAFFWQGNYARRRMLYLFAAMSMMLPGAWMLRNKISQGKAAFCVMQKFDLSPRVAHPKRYAVEMVSDTAKIFLGHASELVAWMVLHDDRYDPIKPQESPQGHFAGTRQLLKLHPTLAFFALGYVLCLLLVYLSAAEGFNLARTYGQLPHAMIPLSVIVYHVLVTVVFTSAYYRQRVPIMPSICILAARGKGAKV